MKRASLLTLTLIGAFSAIQAAWAVDYPLPPTGSRLVGQNQTYTVQEGDKNLQAIARRFDTAAMLILEANNTIAPVPKPGTTITIPSQLLLPDAPRQGIIVPLPAFSVEKKLIELLEKQSGLHTSVDCSTPLTEQSLSRNDGEDQTRRNAENMFGDD